jgi:hypothetical protein
MNRSSALFLLSLIAALSLESHLAIRAVEKQR